MDEDALRIIAPTVVGLTLILTVGGVLVVRPLVRRLAELLHAMTQERLAPAEPKEPDQILDLLSSMDRRLALLEERQSFAESLLSRHDVNPPLLEGRHARQSQPPPA